VTDVYALVRSLRNQQLSRNRHFDEHNTDRGARARRVHRFLIGLSRDLLDARDVRIRRIASGYRISMTFPTVRVTREVLLTDGEHALLLEDQRLASLLAESE
jgi:hypothetical protein